MRHIPNILSALRILMVCLFIYAFIRGQYVWCLILYAALPTCSTATLPADLIG